MSLVRSVHLDSSIPISTAGLQGKARTRSAVQPAELDAVVAVQTASSRMA